MASGGGCWGRGLLGLMLVTLGALAELDDELPELQEIRYVAYQDEDDEAYTGPSRMDADDDPSSISDTTLYALLKVLGSRSAPSLGDRRTLRPREFKRSVFQRLGPSHQTKKGSLPQLCYLKLCAFRRPT